MKKPDSLYTAAKKSVEWFSVKPFPTLQPLPAGKHPSERAPEMAVVTVSGNAVIMNKDKQATDLAPSRFKIWEKAVFEKRDGTTYEANILWYCWFDAPVTLKLNDMDGETWVEVRGELTVKKGSYEKDGETIEVIERHLNKCELLNANEPKAIDAWAGVTSDNSNERAKQWDSARNYTLGHIVAPTAEQPF